MKVCCLCGTAEPIAKLVRADAAEFGVIGNLAGAFRCEDEYDCVRRQGMKMGPLPDAWRGPSFYDFAPDKKARKISSTEVFRCEIVFTPEMQAKLRSQADPKCVICLGNGLYQNPEGWDMCECVLR